jgi:hypothetical protein
MMTVYLVLISEPTTDTPSRNLGGREVWSYVFASLELAQRGVQIDHNNKRARRGLPPEALVWDDTIPKRQCIARWRSEHGKQEREEVNHCYILRGLWKSSAGAIGGLVPTGHRPGHPFRAFRPSMGQSRFLTRA